MLREGPLGGSGRNWGLEEITAPFFPWLSPALLTAWDPCGLSVWSPAGGRREQEADVDGNQGGEKAGGI